MAVLANLPPLKSPRQFSVENLDLGTAKKLNRRWHRTMPRFGTGFVKNQPYPCFGAVYGDVIYAVAIWSNPVARNLPQHEWLELRRFAIGPGSPKYTASWMLGKMTKKIRAWKKHDRLISYQDLGHHTGTIYKAAGWTPTTVNADGNWTREKRPRPTAQSLNPKLRWEKALTPPPPGGEK